MEFLEVPLYDDDLVKLAIRFLFNVIFMALVVTLAIMPNLKKREFGFTAVMMNVMVFFICFTLKKLELQLGMALGLFAIFGVLRYRTDAIRTKEMTYLFILIGIAVINSLSNKKTSYAELVAVNLVVLIGAMVMERLTVEPAKPGKRPGLSKQVVVYDRLELLGTGQRQELFADLKTRTGIDAADVEFGAIDLNASTVKLTVWYADPVESA